MTFESSFFDFQTTNDFLESISPDLGSSSVGEIFGELDAQIEHQPQDQNGQQNWDTTYYNPNPVNQYTQQYPQYANNSTSMSSNSNLNSTSNESPLVSSTNTSPEPLMNKRQELSDEEESIGKSTKKSSKVMKPKSKDKTSHNMIEKKYRTNINSKILALRDAVPSLRIVTGSKNVSIADLEGLTPASKLNKASVLIKATEYIKHLESKNESLRLQNIKLQILIQRASLNQNVPQTISPQVRIQEPQQAPQFQVDGIQNGVQTQNFGFFPENFTSFETPMQTSYSNNSAYSDGSLYQDNSYQDSNLQPQNGSNKYLLGGMATVMATSLFGGGVGTNDYKGLSAFPFFPSFLLNPPAIFLQLWSLTKMILIIASLASIILPKFNFSEKNKGGEGNLLKSWLLVTFGLQMPTTIDPKRKQEILARLSGVQKRSWRLLVNDYVLLSISEVEFENCLLSLIIGRLLIERSPILTRVISRNVLIQGSIILNLEYKGTDVGLKQMNQLIGKVDGLSMLGSNGLCQRLTNLINGVSVNSGITHGISHVKYVQILLEHPHQFYQVLYEWRILGIIDELVVKYMEHIDQKEEGVLQQILKDSQILETLVGNKGTLYEYFRLFKAVVDDQYAPQLLQEVNSGVSKSLDHFRFLVDGQDLTDTEITEDESTEEDSSAEEVTTETQTVEATTESRREDSSNEEAKYEPTLQSQSKLIKSLNLVSDEQFIVLTSSLAVYYFRKGQTDDAAKVISKLRLKETELSVLAFASIVKMINVILPGIEQVLTEESIVDDLISKSRLWLEEVLFMKFSLKSDISKILVQKGLIVNGMADNEVE